MFKLKILFPLKIYYIFVLHFVQGNKAGLQLKKVKLVAPRITLVNFS